MSDREHSHQQGSHGHHHHDHAGNAGPLPESSDPGSKSLADALRVSFVLLAVIMAFMLVGFLLTGLQSIESNEVGIVKVFGRVVRTAGPGLSYNWPFPIGRIEIVKTDEQQLTIYDFWITELPKDAGKPLSQRKAPSDGLRPGWDGALLTGDRYLLHMRIDCRYAVRDAEAFRRWVRDKYPERVPGSEKTREIDPKEEMVRSAVCNAAIIAAATRTADGLQTSDRRSFSKEVMRLANNTLGGEDTNKSTGLVIRRIVLADSTWPLRARAEYDKVLIARQHANEMKDTAISMAEKTLRAAAGEAYTQLVGRSWDVDDMDSRVREFKDTSRAAALRVIFSCLSVGIVADSWGAPMGHMQDHLVLRALIPKVKPYDLIGKYSDMRNRARTAINLARGETVEAKIKALEDQAGDLDDQARQVLERIDRVLLGSDLKGQASRDIAAARADANETKHGVLARLDRYRKLLSKDPQVRRLTMERLWADVRQKILAAADEKYYISTGKGRTVVRINRDPAVVTKQVRESLDKAAKARDEKEK